MSEATILYLILMLLQAKVQRALSITSSSCTGEGYKINRLSRLVYRRSITPLIRTSLDILINLAIFRDTGRAERVANSKASKNLSWKSG